MYGNIDVSKMIFDCFDPQSIGLVFIKVREVIKLIEEDGWYLVRTKGSHRQFKHPHKLGVVTVSGNLGKEMPSGTLNSVLKQAQLKE
jgi:predicted RNA binding protein YcfA (HicA-like mRNA interferase family)